MEPFLIHGPGSHADLIERFFADHFERWTSARYWPSFAITRHAPGNQSVRTSRAYDYATFLSYAVNRRLSKLTSGRQLHVDLLMRLYDRLCSGELTEKTNLVAWAQTSLNTIKRNKAKGGSAVLEHPMSHLNHWMKTNWSFYDDPLIRVKPGYSRFSKWMSDRMIAEYAASDFINVPSSFAKKTFVDAGIDPSRIMVTELGVNPDLFPYWKHARSGSSKLRVAYVGRLELWKGVHLLLNASRKFDNSDIEWTLIGRVLPEIHPFLDSANNVRVLGGLDKEQVSRELSMADVVLLPSFNDAFGLVIIEAMLHGLPVIATTATAGPDIISHGTDGWLIEPNDQGALENAIDHALKNKGQLAAMGEAARQKVCSKYLQSHYFARFADNLRTIGFLS